MKTKTKLKHIAITATLLAVFDLCNLEANPEAEAGFITDAKAAFDNKDIVKLESLICWDGVSTYSKQGIIQNLSGLVQQPVAKVELVATEPIIDYGSHNGHGLKPNLTVTKKLNITFKTDKPPEVEFLIGEKDGKLLITMAVAFSR